MRTKHALIKNWMGTFLLDRAFISLTDAFAISCLVFFSIIHNASIKTFVTKSIYKKGAYQCRGRSQLQVKSAAWLTEAARPETHTEERLGKGLGFYFHLCGGRNGKMSPGADPGDFTQIRKSETWGFGKKKRDSAHQQGCVYILERGPLIKILVALGSKFFFCPFCAPHKKKKKKKKKKLRKKTHKNPLQTFLVRAPL